MPLRLAGSFERRVAFEMRGEPFLAALGLEYRAMGGVFPLHRVGGGCEALLELGIEAGARSEHAVRVARGGPDFAHRAFGREPLLADARPERASDCAGVGASVEDRLEDVHLARP